MKRNWTILLLVTLTWMGASSARCGDDGGNYYPYQFYEEYWRKKEPPPMAKPGQPQARPHPVPQKRAPLFLFPAELGFGVAVGTPEDLFYLGDNYYRASDGLWSRSASWRGPWKQVPKDGLPPELKKRSLAEVRKLRDREFRKFWEEKKGYRGRVFRPAEAPPTPHGKRPN